MGPAGVVVPCQSAATGDAIGRAAVPAARWRKVRRGSFMASSPCIKGTSALLYRILLSGYLSRSAKGRMPPVGTSATSRDDCAYVRLPGPTGPAAEMVGGPNLTPFRSLFCGSGHSKRADGDGRPNLVSD